MTETTEEKYGTHEELKADEAMVEPLQERLFQLIRDKKLDKRETKRVAEDPFFVRRCLIACHNDEKRAYKMGVTALKWRSDFKPSQITLDDFPIAASQNLFQIACHAERDGSPVVFGVAKNWNPWKYSTEEYVKMLAFIYESCEKAMDPADPYARIYFILDMKDMSKFMSDLRKIAQLARVGSEYYPERVVGIAVNADLLTITLWKFLRVLIDKRTRDRVSILRTDFGNFLEEIVGKGQIPPSLGGGDRDEEWPAMTKENTCAFQWTNNDTTAPHTAPHHQKPLAQRHETGETQASAEDEGEAVVATGIV